MFVVQSKQNRLVSPEQIKSLLNAKHGAAVSPHECFTGILRQPYILWLDLYIGYVKNRFERVEKDRENDR